MGRLRTGRSWRVFGLRMLPLPTPVALLWFLIDNDSSTQQLVEELRAEIRKRLPGERLPSTRRLVEAHRVSPVTVSRALGRARGGGSRGHKTRGRDLRRSASRPGDPVDHSWQTVALDERAIDIEGLAPLFDPPHDDGLISLSTGYLHPSLLPVRTLSAALARAARLPDVWDRPPVAGLHALRSWFAKSAAPGIDARDVLVTPGGQGAITTIFVPSSPLGLPCWSSRRRIPGLWRRHERAEYAPCRCLPMQMA